MTTVEQFQSLQVLAKRFWSICSTKLCNLIGLVCSSPKESRRYRNKIYLEQDLFNYFCLYLFLWWFKEIYQEAEVNDERCLLLSTGILESSKLRNAP